MKADYDLVELAGDALHEDGLVGDLLFELDLSIDLSRLA